MNNNNNNNNNNDKVVITIVLVICGILVLGVAAILFLMGVIFFTAYNEIENVSAEHSERYEDYYDEYEDEEYEENEDNEEDYGSSSIDENYSTDSFTKILPSEIASLSKNKTIVVWVGRQSCGYCGMYAPVLEDVGKDNNVTIYYVDFEDLVSFDSQYPYISDERNYNILEGLDGVDGWETFAKDNIGGTPLTLIIKDNKVVGGLSGYTEENGVLDEFKRTGLIEN